MVISSDLQLLILNTIREPLFVLSRNLEVIFANNALWAALPANSPNGQLKLPHSAWFWPGLNQVEFPIEPFSAVFSSLDNQQYAVKLRASALSGGNYLIQLLDGLEGVESNRDFHGQRLQTLGMLSSGVAHDFNNILTGILGHLAYVKASAQLVGQQLDSLNSIEEGAKKASEIAQQIVRFSKVDSSEESKSINLSQLVERTCRLLRGAISSKFQLSVKGSGTSHIHVLGIEAKLAQVLVNLVVNARDACDQGGCINVSVEEIRDVKFLSNLLATDELACDSYAVLRVEDNGHGMAPDVLERIFEPYFSTKEEHGTGIGLFTVLNIVKSFGGAIEVESASNSGTKVSIYLPQISSVEADSIKDQPFVARVKSSAKKSILVVDDEYTVRNVLNLALQHLGYEVTVASSGLEAISIYKERNKPFDLVLLDMLMPHMSGEQTFKKLKELDSAVRVMIISGFTSEEAIRAVLAGGGLGFIQKPFTIEALATRIEEVLF